MIDSAELISGGLYCIKEIGFPDNTGTRLIVWNRHCNVGHITTCEPFMLLGYKIPRTLRVLTSILGEVDMPIHGFALVRLQ